MNADVLEQVEKTTRRAPKDALLAQLDEQGQRLVKMALDPDITFGITVDEDEMEAIRTREQLDPTGFWDDLEGLLKRLQARDLTGNAAIDEVETLLAYSPSRLECKWTCRILNRQLRAGFDIKTFNRVFGEGSVEKFAVQLAATYEGEDLEGAWHIQPKLDGNRVILIDGEARSRNGKLYPAAQHVVGDLESVYPGFFKKWVVDGEMMGDLGFDQSSGALRRLSQDGRKEATFTYWVFDLIDREDWEKRHTPPLGVRYHEAALHLGNRELRHVRLVPTELVFDPTIAKVNPFLERYLKQGFEGAMLKDTRARYQFKRARNLLKVKKFYDADLTIVGFYEGKGKHKGRLGGIIVEGEIGGVQIRSECGSGFDDPTRELIWADRKGWLGAVVQVQYQSLTDKGSLRFPVFVMRRRDKE